MKQQSAAAQEQGRKIQNKEDAIETPWFRTSAALGTQLDLFPTTLKSLRLRADGARKEATVFYDHFYHKHILWRIQDAESDVERCVLEGIALFSELDTNMVLARRLGKKDFRANNYLEKHGYGELNRKIDLLAFQVEATRKSLAELLYTTAWKKWHKERTRFQAAEAIRATQDLKHSDSLQSASTKVTDRLHRAYQNLKKLLDELDVSLVPPSTQIGSRREAEHFVAVTVIAMNVRTFANNISANGHDWRRLDRQALLESRFSQLIDHTPIEIRARQIINDARSDMALLGYASLAGLRGSRTGPKSRFTIYSDIRKRCRMFNELFVEFTTEYLNFLQEGLFMLNPAMRTRFGRLKYAMMRPFFLLPAAIGETQKVLREGREVIELTRGRGQLDKISRKSPPDLKWAKKLFERYDAAYAFSKSRIRGLLEDCNDALPRMGSRLLLNDGDQFLDMLDQENQTARAEMSEHRALNTLSSLQAYSDYTQSTLR